MLSTGVRDVVTPRLQTEALGRRTPTHSSGIGEFNKGNIYRIELHNFMTYSHVEFFPG